MTTLERKLWIWICTNTCKSSGGCRDAKITSLRNDHVFNFGAELIIVFIRSEAVIDKNLKPLRIFRNYYSLEISHFHVNFPNNL